MTKFRWAWLLCCILLVPSSTLESQEQKPSFYQQIVRGVFRLEHQDPTTGQVDTATAFFVRATEGLYVVTAGHNARSGFDWQGQVVMRNKKTGATKVWKLNLPHSRWVLHPDIGNARRHPVDVAAMKIPMQARSHEEGEMETAAFAYCAESCPQGEYNQLESDPEPPLQVIVFGFPGHLGLQLREPRPMGRQGMVALTAGEEFVLVDGRYAEEKAFLIDIKMFPGNSGSPVISLNALRGKVNLAGLVISTRPFDYAVAEPVSPIKQVVDLARSGNLDFQPWRLPE